MSVIKEKKIVVKGNPLREQASKHRELSAEQKQQLAALHNKHANEYVNQKPDPTKPTVLYVVTKANWGGAQKYVYDLAHYFRRDYNIAVAYGKNEFTGKNLFQEKMQELGVAIYPVEHMGKRVVFGDDLSSAIELFRIIKTVSPAVLHLNSPKAAGLGGLVGRLLRVPKIVYTIHGLTSFQEMKPYERVVIDWLTRLTCRFSHNLITISQLEQSYVNNWGDSITNKNTLIYHGIHPIDYVDPLDKLNSISSSASGKTQDLMGHSNSIIIGSIGELTANKGYFFLLEALAQVITTKPHTVLIHYGTGDQETLLRHEAERLGIIDHILFKGFEKMASSYITAFDIFVLPSIKEGLPYVLLEAAGAAAPVIATNVGGIPEIITDLETGVLIPPKNIDALVNAIVLMIDDSDQRKLYGQKLKESVSRKFSLEQMYEKTAAVYNS